MSLFDGGRGALPLQLADLLPIEDSDALIGIACDQTGIPIWPNVRVAFFRLIMCDLLFSTGTTDPPLAQRDWRSLVTLGRAALHNAGLRLRGGLKSDLLINTEAIGDELVEGKWFNRYVDPFGDVATGQALVLTDMFEWTWRSPRHNPRIYYHAPIQAEAALRGKVSVPAAARDKARQLVDLLDDRARALIGWEFGAERKDVYTARVATRIATLPLRYRRYRSLIRRVSPKVLVGSSGCYGFHAPLIAAARDLGVVTAEYQHGGISEGHDGYNFAPAIFASQAYRRTLPEYLLTYGDWWGDHINAPIEIVTIGYPARAAKLARLVPSREHNDVLILSDGVEFGLYLALARQIAEAVGPLGLQVVIRPHPMERSAVAAKWGDGDGFIRIDAGPDIYASFLSAHTVVSEVSTGLFEAVGLVDRIVLLGTAKARFAYPDHPFAVADSAAEVIDLIMDRATAKPRIDPASLWAPDWRKRYRAFLAEKGGVE